MKFLLLLLIPFFGYSQTTNLLISEYGEGSGGNKKYIEIYNGTGSSIDLANYQLWKNVNGSAWSVTILPLTGTLVDGGTYSVANNNVDVIGASIYTTWIGFNGDDAIGLAWNGGSGTTFTVIDAVGEQNIDPGAGWDVAGVANATVDKILVRKPTVCSPNTNWTQSRGTNTTDSEWTIFQSFYNSTTHTTNLGAHTSNCIPTCDTYRTITTSECGSLVSPSGNYTWTTTGTYNDTIPNVAACDSIITYNLTINSIYNENAVATICSGSSYIFGSQTLTVAGPYSETFPSVSGCDSTVNLTLTVVSDYNENISATICSNETYILGSQTLSSPGSYSELFTSSTNCDSTVNLTLSVLPISTNAIVVVECDSYTSPSGNYTWTTSGLYVDTVQAANGCDSIIDIDLTINNSELIQISATACDSYVFEGNTYNTTGVYQVAFMNASNCDSIRELTLTITNTPSAPTVSANQNLCFGDAVSNVTASGGESIPLIIAGVMDGPLPGGLPKCVEFYAIEDISDLSIFGFGSATNGGGTDGIEFTFPALSLNAGDYYRVATDSISFNDFMGFYPENVDGNAGNINGDDAIELFMNNVVIDVFGEIDVDGTGQAWDYLDGWAYRNNNSSPNGGIWNINEWTFSGINVLDGEITNTSATTPYPTATLNTNPPTFVFSWYDDALLTTNLFTGDDFATGQTTGSTSYYATVSLNGCESTTNSTTISINSLPTITTSSDFSVCGNETFTLSGSGGDSYVWDNLAINNSPMSINSTTLFTVIGTDLNGCSNNASVTVTHNELPTVSLATLGTVCINHDPSVLNQGSPVGGTYSGTGVSAGSFTPTTAGVGTHLITYNYTDVNGCMNSATGNIIVDGCANIEEKENNLILIYPNPANNKITIEHTTKTENEFNIIDPKGTVVISKKSNDNLVSFDLTNIANGTYFIEIKNENGSSYNKFIKQ